MLTRIALATLVVLPLSGAAQAADRLVPPPPVPNAQIVVPSVPQPVPSVQVPPVPQPYIGPAIQSGNSLVPAPEMTLPVQTPASPLISTPTTTPSISDGSSVIQYGAPGFQYPVNPVMQQDGTVSQYLYQPAAGTYPPSQSQYNAFSTTGMPYAPMSFSPTTGMHDRYPYYSYRRPWYTPGWPSHNVNIIW